MKSPTKDNPSNIENLKISISFITDFVDYLKTAPKTELNLALYNLFRESLREMQEFSMDRENITRTSLNVRNIFEIYLITMHISVDDQGRKNWFGQMHKDMLDVRNGFRALLKSNGMEAPELDEIDEFCNVSLDQSPYESSGGFNLKGLSDKYGFSHHYSFIYKLSSKLIHPTSMKVNGYDTIDDDKNYLKVMTYCGIFFSYKMCELAISLKEKSTNK